MSNTERITAVQTIGENAGSSTLASVRPLLGPSWIIKGEDPERYEKVLAEVAPQRSLSTHRLVVVKDIVDLTWEIQRTHPARKSYAD